MLLAAWAFPAMAKPPAGSLTVLPAQLSAVAGECRSAVLHNGSGGPLLLGLAMTPPDARVARCDSGAGAAAPHCGDALAAGASCTLGYRAEASDVSAQVDIVSEGDDFAQRARLLLGEVPAPYDGLALETPFASSDPSRSDSAETLPVPVAAGKDACTSVALFNTGSRDAEGLALLLEPEDAGIRLCRPAGTGCGERIGLLQRCTVGLIATKPGAEAVLTLSLQNGYSRMVRLNAVR